MINREKLHPGYLWIGSCEYLKNYTKDFIKKVYCINNDNGFCDNCADCTKVNLGQHHLVRWLSPEGQYTVKQLEIIFETIIFELEKDQEFFFILDKAELLNTTAANSLLKSLEEPPASYHFILLANRQEGILPTISSRCIVQKFDFQDQNEISVLASFFTSQILQVKFQDFSKELERSKISEHEILDLIDKIYFFWSQNLKKALLDQDQKNIKISKNIISILDNVRQYTPMPGSSKIFLKNLYLQFVKNIIHL